jgi:hypothetical protein
MISSSAHEMHDFKRVAPFEQRRAVGFAGNDVAIELDDDAAGTNLQLFEKLADAQPVGNLFFFSVETNFHINAKTAFTRATSRWPGNTVLSSSRAEFPSYARCGTSTLTLPYAGATRIRFEGLPVVSGSQSAASRHP